jgi:hypothetical protein
VAAEALLLPAGAPLRSLKPASVSFLKRFLENLPMTYPELFVRSFASKERRAKEFMSALSEGRARCSLDDLATGIA